MLLVRGKGIFLFTMVIGFMDVDQIGMGGLVWAIMKIKIN
jgi:hypothetical protein